MTPEPEPTPDSAVRALPHDPDNERGVLAAMLADPPLSVLDGLKALRGDHFYLADTRAAFETMQAMADAGKTVDPLTLQTELRDTGRTVDKGGPCADNFVGQLVAITAVAAHLPDYAGVVREKAMRRAVLAAGNLMREAAFDTGRSIDSIVAEAEGLLTDMRSDEAEPVRHVREIMPEVIDELEATWDAVGDVTGIPTGFTELDRMLRGWQPGQQVVIAGRPSMGKTTLGINFVEHAALDCGKTCLVFSLEMTAVELLKQMLCRRSEYSLSNARAGFKGKNDLIRIHNQMDDIVRGEIYIDATPNLSIQQMKVRARLLQLKLGGRLDIVFTDYLQLASSATKRAAANRQQEIAEISRGGKLMARELGLTHIIAAQVGRGAEEREGGVPKMSDLRESGAIEQDADVVIFISRPGRHYKDKEDDEGTIVVAKQRSGPVGQLKPVEFIPDIALFRDIPKSKGGGGGNLYN